MKYKVQLAFHDAEDKQKLYEKGSRYPRPARKKIDPVRLKNLLELGVIVEDRG